MNQFQVKRKKQEVLQTSESESEEETSSKKTEDLQVPSIRTLLRTCHKKTYKRCSLQCYIENVPIYKKLISLKNLCTFNLISTYDGNCLLNLKQNKKGSQNCFLIEGFKV